MKLKKKNTAKGNTAVEVAVEIKDSYPTLGFLFNFKLAITSPRCH